MKCLLLLFVLMFATALQAAERPPPNDIATSVAIALAQAQQQAAMKLASERQLCDCGNDPTVCTCAEGRCQCANGNDCRVAKVQTTYSILVISRSACVPCERVRAALQDVAASDFHWDIWKDAPAVEAKYGGVTAYPTILLLKDGREVSRHVGSMTLEQIKAWMANPSQSIVGGDYVRPDAVPQWVTGGVYSGGVPYGGGTGGFMANSFAASAPGFRPMMNYSAACRGSS